MRVLLHGVLAFALLDLAAASSFFHAPSLKPRSQRGIIMRLRGGAAEFDADMRSIAVYSKKNRLKMTLSDFMRERCIHNPEDQQARDLELIMSGIQAAW
jgi:hypothetical protein